MYDLENTNATQEKEKIQCFAQSTDLITEQMMYDKAI
jgi:hypothetical protein